MFIITLGYIYIIVNNNIIPRQQSDNKIHSLVESFRSDCFTSVYLIIKSDALLQVMDNKILCVNEIEMFKSSIALGK
jgi:hypothetical protein